MNARFITMSIKTLASCIIALLISEKIQAQDSTILENFEVFEIDSKVQITATINSGFTCYGINFLRSEDSISGFQSIGEIAGVCGSISESVRYDFTDTNPPNNKTLYYKIQMGGLGYSEILSIRLINIENDAYLVIPNPSFNNCRIYFKNDLLQNNTLRLFSKYGNILGSFKTSDNFFEIDVKGLVSGVYIFTIENNDLQQSIEGKITVHK